MSRLTDRTQAVIDLAGAYAAREGCSHPASEHLLLALLSERHPKMDDRPNVAVSVLKRVGIDVDALKVCIEARGREDVGAGVPAEAVPAWGPECEAVLDHANRASSRLLCNYVGTEHLLWGLAVFSAGGASALLIEAGVDIDSLRTAILSMYRGECSPSYGEDVGTLRNRKGAEVDQLTALQTWYARHCDGEWEHSHGVTIETCDNPGWRVRVDLPGTGLASRKFVDVRENVSGDGHPVGDRWFHCYVEDEVWNGAGDETTLPRIIQEFLTWAHVAERAG